MSLYYLLADLSSAEFALFCLGPDYSYGVLSTSQRAIVKHGNLQSTAPPGPEVLC